MAAARLLASYLQYRIANNSLAPQKSLLPFSGLFGKVSSSVTNQCRPPSLSGWSILSGSRSVPAWLSLRVWAYGTAEEVCFVRDLLWFGCG